MFCGSGGFVLIFSVRFVGTLREGELRYVNFVLV